MWTFDAPPAPVLEGALRLHAGSGLARPRTPLISANAEKIGQAIFAALRPVRPPDPSQTGCLPRGRVVRMVDDPNTPRSEAPCSAP